MQSCIFLGEVQFFLGRDLTVLVTLIDKKHNNYIENTILYMCTTCTSSNCKKTLPTLPSSAQRRMCSGHLLTSRAQGDVWYTNYSVWTEPWKPGLKFNLFLCNFVFFVTILFKGYCMPMFTTFARQNKYWQWLKYVRYLYVTCSELQNLSNRTQGGRDT